MMKLKALWILVVFICYVRGGFSRTEANPNTKNLLQRLKRQTKATKAALKVTDYHVRCQVASRYAVTSVQSSVWNQLSVTKEAAFQVDLPSAAFISNFTISSGGKVYAGQVKERAAARKVYDAAKKRGRAAGLVATKERETEKFRVAVSVPAGARLTFLLTYEELLPRRLGRYQLSLGLRPGQLVQNLTLEVSITEQTGISFVKVLPLKTSRLLSRPAEAAAGAPASTQVERSSCCARVSYSPSLQQQSSISSSGLHADFTIQYDVELRDVLGEVQVHDGYFVHYFAPRGLPVVPKDVIFVIDVSGSMTGTKIRQTKQAMSTILAQLREGDHFNIITFSDHVHTWRRGRTVRATRQNVREATEFVRRMIADGWTNINAALLSAAQLLNPPPSSRRLSAHRVPLVIFLTDGEATIGVTGGDAILTNARKALGSASLFGLAFGDDADFPLLKRLALDNRGVARMVYEDADAALQLQGFYDEVASPLLSDVQLSYLDEQAFDITRSLFPNYFQGSELVVVGKVKPGVRDLTVSMSATDSRQRLRLEDTVLSSQPEDSTDSLDCFANLDGLPKVVRRLWAYFTIKELLQARLNASDPAAQRLLLDKATNLSLSYNFVTPVTSLVVVKPELEDVPAPSTTAAATVTTTANSTATSRAAAAGRRLGSLSRGKPDAKAPPTKPKASTPKTALPPSKRTTTSSPSSVQSPPAPFSGKKPGTTQNSKAAPPPGGGKGPTSLINPMKTAAAPAPARVSTPQNQVWKTSAPTQTILATTSTSPPPSSPRTGLGAQEGRPPTPQLGTGGLTTAAPELPQTGITAAPPLSSPPSPPTPAPPPATEPSHTNLEVAPGLATLVSATFAPMPGVTDQPKLWEAVGLLDVSTFIHSQDVDLVTDYDATYDYEYDLNYDTWDDTADLESFDPLSRLGTARIFSSSVDGDPHFVVSLPKLQEKVCFTVDGRADDVLRLLEDPDRGIIVDGHLTGAPPKRGVEGRSRTYFDLLTVSMDAGGPGDITITLSLDGVVVDGEGRDVLPIDQQGWVRRRGVTVAVDNRRSCWVELAKDIRFLVLLHQYQQPSYLQKAHLGFYVVDGRGLSASTQGLLGQFQHASATLSVEKDHVGGAAHTNAALARGFLRWGTEDVPVTLQDKMLKDSVQKHHPGKCWVVGKAEVERLLGHPYQSYVV